MPKPTEDISRLIYLAAAAARGVLDPNALPADPSTQEIREAVENMLRENGAEEFIIVQPPIDATAEEVEVSYEEKVPYA